MKKILLLSILFTSILFGCKKGIEDKQTAELTANFFKLPDNIKTEVKRVYDYLKNKNEEKEFVSHFVNTQGLLDWSKATVSRKQNIVTKDSDEPQTEDPIYVEIPLLEPLENFAKGFLIAKETNQNIQLLLINGEKFNSLPNGELTDNTLNAEDLVMKLMIMNKELYGNSEFKIIDNKLFDVFVTQNEKVDAALVGGRVIITNLQVNSTSTYGRFISYTTSYNYETPYKCCKTPDFCNKQPGGCDWNKPGGCSSCTCSESHSIPMTVTSWVDSPDKNWIDYGGNSNGSGSTGTGSSTTTTVDCNPELLPMQVFKLCDPDNKPITLMTEDEIIDANVIIDSTTKNSRTECLITKLRKNAFAKSLFATFDGNNKNSLTYIIGNTPNGDWGITRGLNNNKYEITIAKPVDSLYSNIAIYTTILHELIHARLYYAMEQAGYLKFDVSTKEALLNVDTSGGNYYIKLDTMAVEDRYVALINAYFNNYVKKGYPQEQWTHSLFSTAYFDLKSYRQKLEDLIFDMGNWSKEPTITQLTMQSYFGSNWSQKVAEYLSWKGLEKTPEFQSYILANSLTLNDFNTNIALIKGIFDKTCQ